MKTTFGRSRSGYAASLAIILAVIVLALVAAWVFMVIWVKGGPQPVHRIVIALPAPQSPAAPGHGA